MVVVSVEPLVIWEFNLLFGLQAIGCKAKDRHMITVMQVIRELSFFGGARQTTHGQRSPVASESASTQVWRVRDVEALLKHLYN